MDEQKTLILSVDFQTDEALSRAANFRYSIEANQQALKDLNKEIKESSRVTEEQLVQREKLEQAIRQDTRARADELRALDNYLKATKAQMDANGKWQGSIKDMRAAVGFLTEQWNNLSREERENAEVGGKMQREIKNLTDELKELEGSVGDNRRSVGGYLDAIRQAPGALGKFKAGINGISTAMAANPFGLILQLLPQIQALFNSSGEGADAFAEAMGIVNAIVQEGLKRLVALGGAAFKLFTGDFKGAFEQGSAALSNFAGSIEKAVKEGGALAKNLDELEAKERAFKVSSAETERQINNLITQSKARKTSEADRIKLLEKAEALELNRNKQEIALAEERIKLIQDENRIKQEDSDVQDERLKEAQANKIKLQAQTDQIIEKINNRKDALDIAREEKQKARAERLAKDQAKAAEEAAEKVVKALEKITAAETQQAKDIADLKEMDAKAAAEEEQFKIDVARADQKRRDEELADAKKKTQEKINLKEAEFQAISTLAKAAADIAKVIADENSELAVFQKAITGFQIALNTAQAISKLTASSTEVAAAVAAASGPAGLITGPLAYASYYGTQIAAIITGMAQAKQLLTAEPPKKMADGGLLEGASHAQGGIRGTGRFANVEVEGGEAVINRRSTARFAGLLDAINQAGGGRPLSPTTYAAAGGILSPSAIQPLTGGSYMNAGQAAGIDYNELAKAMAAQPVYVRPTEITSLSNKTNARKAQATIG